MLEARDDRRHGATGPVRLIVAGSTWVILSIVWLALGNLGWFPNPDTLYVLGSVTGGLLVIAVGVVLAIRRRRT